MQDQLAAVDSVRYLPRYMRQRSGQGRPRHRLETAARIGLHPRPPARDRYLLLPRVTAMVHEERTIGRGVAIDEATPIDRASSVEGPVLRLRPIRRGDEDCPGRQLLYSTCRDLHHSPG